MMCKIFAEKEGVADQVSFQSSIVKNLLLNRV